MGELWVVGMSGEVVSWEGKGSGKRTFGEDDVFDADGEAVEWASIFGRDLVECAGLGEHEGGIEVGPGLYDGVAGGDAGEEGLGVGFDCEVSFLH